MQKITTFLTFKSGGEEAIQFYVSLFKNSKINNISHASIGQGNTAALMNGSFVLDGQEFYAMDAGDYFSFAPGISLFVSCDTQEEIDHFYDAFAKEGEAQPCGWVKDKWGVSWQIVPPILGQLLGDPNKGAKVAEAMMKMKKLIIKDLEAAAK